MAVMAVMVPGPPWAWSIVEAVLIILLLAWQGLPLTQPCACARELLARVRCRLGLPRRCSLQRCAEAAALWLTATGLLAGAGIASGFICFTSDDLGRPWELVKRLALLMVAPALIEELIFRCLLLPLPQSCAAPPEAAFAEPLALTEELALEETAGAASEAVVSSSPTPVQQEDLRLPPDALGKPSVAEAVVDGASGSPGAASVGKALERTPPTTAGCSSDGHLSLDQCTCEEGHDEARVGFYCLSSKTGRGRPWQVWGQLPIFIVYHLDLIHSNPRHTFADLRFLALALILGVACTEALLRSGSLWPPVLCHGSWVFLWLSFGRCW
eukprot:TRINITY_DN2205_c0_g3_i1.p1 TRINITY_DN2205_c0_g3~~TRINITY_DN2205_c0_g3_i1.p1  ORF type:complete len:340 (-),score=66.66 TRINITY_DN2205_c0_g3_i1:76-1056(-)